MYTTIIHDNAILILILCDPCIIPARIDPQDSKALDQRSCPSKITILSLALRRGAGSSVEGDDGRLGGDRGAIPRSASGADGRGTKCVNVVAKIVVIE